MRVNESSGRALAVGLTGGIACGKSEVGRVLAAEGLVVRDADDVAHELIRRGGAAFDAVSGAFGPEFLGSDGEVDRRSLGKLVFADAAARRRLEAIVHPLVIDELNRWVEATTAAGDHAVAIVPLLYEVGYTGPWNAVICVTAPEDVVLARLRARGLSPREAADRMRAQMSVSEKESRADYVIRNDGTLADLERETRNVWKRLLNKE